MERLYYVFVVALGACVGAVLRNESYFFISKLTPSAQYATLFVNVIGSFLIGFLFILFSQLENHTLQLLVITGLLGSFTTFSTFSLDTIKMLTTGQYSQAFIYIGLQLILGISCCFVGLKIGQFWFR